MNIKETKKNIIQAGQKAVEELIKVAKEAIVDSDDDISADRLKNAAATKKLAIFDAFEILNRIHEEESMLNDKPVGKDIKKKIEFKGFAEGRSK
tara:strand:+ start:243 stop:524 length:282 start_codon:yes stop_codon:yes gene_type:complete